MIIYKSQREIDLMIYAGQVLARIFDRIRPLVKPGVATSELDAFAHECMREEGCTPSFLGYRGFPAVSCASVNEEVVHGIPADRRLEEGDILSFDIGVIWQGYHADAARTWPIGEVDEDCRKLMDSTATALDLGIETIAVGSRLSAIGAAVQEFAEKSGYSVVRDFVGHGIGRELHEDPQVPNYVDPGVLRRDIVLKKGLVIAIEPMLNVGTERVETMGDGWTVVTKDRRLSSHFEDTIAVTEDGPVVLTRHRD